MDYLTWFIVGIVLYGLYLMYKSKKSSFGNSTGPVIATMEGCPHCTPIKQGIKNGQIKTNGIKVLDTTTDSDEIEKLGIQSFPYISNGKTEFTGSKRTPENINKFMGK